MNKNVGLIDRVLRVLIGLALLWFAVFSGHPYAWLGYIGIMPILTALMSTCPLYTVLGISSCPAKKA